jgi:excisionase family DNA binding protein
MTADPTPAAPARLLPIQEAARRLDLSRGYLYVLMDKGALPFVKIGRRRMIRETALEEYMAGLG